MKIVLAQPVEKRYGTVVVEVGDFVKIQEWDGVQVQGIVSFVNKQVISVHNAQFLGGAHSCCDYTEYKVKRDFVFNLNELCYIKVAYFEENTPLSLIEKALSENYCGSESIVMSAMFHRWYMEHMKDHRWFSSYCSIPIHVDETNLAGICVYAIPNEESRKHKMTPKRCYELELFRKGKWVGSHIMSCFEEDLDNALAHEFSKAQCLFGAYRLLLGGTILERGTPTKRYPVNA